MNRRRDILFQRQPVTVPVDGEECDFAVRRIYCVGRNYVSHIREMKEGDERDPPFFFQKPADAIVASGGTIAYPPATGDLQYEVELVAAIGKSGARISAGDALAHVFGYAVGLDMTRRDLQFKARDQRRPWEAGKSFDQSAPCGAIRRTISGAQAPSGEIALFVNDECRQRAQLGELIWNVPEIIANLSIFYELAAGDLIMTGTPSGVGPVTAGDAIVGRVDGLPDISVTIATASARKSESIVGNADA